MSFSSITYTNDVLDEFNVKMTLSKSGTTCKIFTLYILSRDVSFKSSGSHTAHWSKVIVGGTPKIRHRFAEFLVLKARNL